MEDHAHLTRRFWLEVPEMTRFDFKPGQFVTLDLPIHEKPIKRLRSYSISSCPDGTNVFELIVVKTPGGLGSTWLFNEAKTGTEIRFRGAQGVFTLPEPLTKDLFLICTGTGIAPFRSMIHYIAQKKIPAKKVYLIFGCRKKEDLLYYDELKKLETNIPGFTYIPTLSREKWDGHQGYVHTIYEELCKDRPDADFFLCGWKHMVDEARNRILALGYPEKAIHLELYG